MKKIITLILACFLLVCSFNKAFATVYYTRQNGLWSATATWSTVSCGGAAATAVPSTSNDTVEICNTHSVSITTNPTCGKLTIDNGGKLGIYKVSGVNKSLTISGDFVNNGTYDGNSGGNTNFNTTIKTYYGQGTVSNPTIWIFNVNTTIDAAAVISKPANFSVASGKVVTNNGSVTSTTGSVVGAGTWTNAASSFLSVGTNITVGTLNASASGNTVEYGGSGSYNIKIPSSNTFENLTLLGGGTKTATAALTINGTVSVSGATTVFATGANTITIPSSASGSARIGTVDGSITGTAWKIQRYIPASTANWQDMSTPINGNNISDWDAELYMTFGSTNCGDGTAANFYSVDYFSNDGSQAFTQVSTCNAALSIARGYEIWLGTSMTTMNATTLDSRGTPVFGNQPTTLAGGNGNWSLIGNPYASGIDWSVLYADASTAQIDNFFSCYDETINDYAIWDPLGVYGGCTGQLCATGGVLSAHQGFWVQATGGSPSITFQESYKTAGDVALVKQSHPIPNDVLRMKLSSALMKNSCEASVTIKNNSSEYFDATTDISFRKSPDPSTPSLTPVSQDGKHTRVKSIPVKQNLSLPVEATIPVAGNYTIDFTGIQTIFKYRCVFFEDSDNGTVISLSGNNNSYSFTQSSNLKTHNFILHFSNECDRKLQPFANSVRVYTNEEGAVVNFAFDEITNTDISVFNSLGQNVVNKNVKADNEPVVLPIEKTGQVYFVKVTTSAGTSTYKIFY